MGNALPIKHWPFHHVYNWTAINSVPCFLDLSKKVQTRMSTSFPFLKIARERNISYGVVIRLVQALERIPDTPMQRTEMNWSIIFEDVRKAMLAERQRRLESGGLNA
jgi:hypothetical protein